MTHPTKRFLFSAIAAIVLLAACLPQQQPTQSPEDIANQISTSVALTVAAQNAQTQTAQPVATNTTLPTQTEAVPFTETPIVPTATPFVIVPATATVVSGGGGGGSGGVVVRPEFDCTPVNNRPRDNTVFHRNEEFDIKWTIVNTGTKTIPARLDVTYFSGPKLMEDPTDTFRELPQIRPGDSAVIIIDAIAPDARGFHVMTWRVEGGMCAPYIAIIVE